ncbi:MAG: segregation/condensation protein A [Candidatus Marinimicrobia bacterium]|nr:segregation/condensation protein A [Candidatus Neomarinimicrobiota bacterium]
MAYQVHLDNFEGPLDLLLYFIQRDKIDIYDIPIAHITREYLEYLDLMEALNLAVAGEFILLAATLMRIKARMLLPRPEPVDDELMADPRQELVHQLIEYRRFKAASISLGKLAARRSVLYPVGRDLSREANGTELGNYLQGVNLFQLMVVVREVLGQLPAQTVLELQTEPIQLDDSIRTIRRALASARQVVLQQIFSTASGVQEVVVLFLAVLELIRRGAATALQATSFGEIVLVAVPEN